MEALNLHGMLLFEVRDLNLQTRFLFVFSFFLKLSAALLCFKSTCILNRRQIASEA